MTFHQITELRWSRRALQDLSEIHAYIAEDKPAAADRQIALLLRSVEGLISLPAKGRPGRIEGARELAVPGTSHIVVYEVLETIVFVVAILHGARRWPTRILED